MKCYYMGSGFKTFLLCDFALFLVLIILDLMEKDFVSAIILYMICTPILPWILAWNKPIIQMDKNQLKIYKATKKPDVYLLSDIEIYKVGGSIISILHKKDNKVKKTFINFMELSKTDKEDFKRMLPHFLENVHNTSTNISLL